jgi:hypothetical protein
LAFSIRSVRPDGFAAASLAETAERPTRPRRRLALVGQGPQVAAAQRHPGCIEEFQLKGFVDCLSSARMYRRGIEDFGVIVAEYISGEGADYGLLPARDRLVFLDSRSCSQLLPAQSPSRRL